MLRERYKASNGAALPSDYLKLTWGEVLFNEAILQDIKEQEENRSFVEESVRNYKRKKAREKCQQK